MAREMQRRRGLWDPAPPQKPCRGGGLPLHDLAPVVPKTITPCHVPQDSVLSGRQDGPSGSFQMASLLPESLRLLNGVEKLLLQLLVTLVGRQIQAVEAERGKGWLAGAALLTFGGGGVSCKSCHADSPRVASRQPGLLANFVNAELLGSVAA